MNRRMRNRMYGGVRASPYVILRRAGYSIISWPSVSRGCKVLVRCEFRCHCRVANGAVCVGCG